MKYPNIYAVIVTFNGIRWIEKCLSALNASDIPVNIIVIDNGSNDGTLECIAFYKKVDLIKSDTNLGFGKANNIGIKKAIDNNADYVFLLNQDGYVEPETISRLIGFHQMNTDYGVLSPRQMNGSGTNLDKNFNDFVLSKSNIIKHDKNKFYQVNFVMAAFWLVTSNCLNKVGGFDPIFSHYGEDNDYLNRVVFHKFKVGIFMDSVGYHDREHREENDEKKLSVNYAALLAKATNINDYFAIAFFKMIYYYIRFSGKSLLSGDFNLFFLNQKMMTALISKMGQIIVSRKNNKAVYGSIL